MTEPISPSVCRSANRNTVRRVSAVAIARARIVGLTRPAWSVVSARQAAIASSLNQTVRLPRWRKPASYFTTQFVTRSCCLGM